MFNKEIMIGKLKEKGLKITSQRLAVLDAFVKKGYSHPSASSIYKEAKKKCKRISLSAVYAILKELSAKGIIKILEFDKTENRYDGNLADHINLICKQCGNIIDYNLPTAIASNDIVHKSGFVVTDTRMECYGYCRDCLKRPI